MFFYSGHGVQLGAANYLLPVDINNDSEEQVKDDSIPLQRLLDDMQEQKVKFGLAIIDACRDNPFKGSGRAIGGARGLAPANAANGQMVVYSAGAGQQALDRLDDNDRNKNGVFTRVLLREMQKPGVEVRQLLRNVRTQVVRMAKSAGYEQMPAVYDQAEGDFYFFPAPPSRDESANPQPATRIKRAEEIEQETWESARNSNNADTINEYLKQYPKGRFVGQAKVLIATFNTPKPEAVSAAPLASAAQQPSVSTSPTLNPAQIPEMVRLPSGILMGKYEVTQGQWRAVMGDNPSWFKECGDNCPVEGVSWDDVQRFIERLNSQTGKRFRLPTEDEWDSACQAGSDKSEYCGSNDIDAVAWYNVNSEKTTHPVGQKQKNGYGLYDMSGNVWEWTSSCYEADCSRRVIRGGSWDFVAALLSSANRTRLDPAYRDGDLGFRLVQDR